MERKTIFIFFTLMLISLQPFAFGQFADKMFELKENQKNLEIGQQIKADKVIFEFTKQEKIHVKQVVKLGQWSDNKHVEIIEGIHSNLRVLDEDGDPIGYGISGETFEESEYVVLKQKLNGIDIVIEYDLENFLTLKDGLWFAEINYPFDIELIFSEEVPLVLVNSRPIDISEVKGINCMGCSMVLEFFDVQKNNSYEIFIDEKMQNLEILTNGEIKKLQVIDELNVIEFETSITNQIFIMKIPFGIILNPFDVYLSESDSPTIEQIDKIRKTEFQQDEDSVKISFRGKLPGLISIVGATESEHNDLRSKIEQRNQSISDKDDIGKDSSLSLTNLIEGDYKTGEKNTVNTEEVFEEWKEKNPTEKNNANESLIYLTAIGIIVAIIIGIIIKVKKN